MYSIAESMFAENNAITLVGIDALRSSFQHCYPYIVDIIIGEADYARMFNDTLMQSGSCHPVTTTGYGEDFRWAIYYPGQSTIISPFRDGIMACMRVGFINQTEALVFKLAWFNS